METKKKWYNDHQMVGTLLIFWPPLGIYGVYRSGSIPQRWKIATYSALALAIGTGLFIYLS